MQVVSHIVRIDKTLQNLPQKSEQKSTVSEEATVKIAEAVVEVGRIVGQVQWPVPIGKSLLVFCSQFWLRWLRNRLINIAPVLGYLLTLGYVGGLVKVPVFVGPKMAALAARRPQLWSGCNIRGPAVRARSRLLAPL